MERKNITRMIGCILMMISYTYMVVITMLQVILRYFGIVIVWAEESARYAFVWLTFLGVAYVSLTDEHLKIDFIVDMLPRKTKRIVSIIAKLLVAIFLMLLLKIGIDQALLTSRAKSFALGINLGFIYAAVPIMVIIIFISNIEEKVKDTVQKIKNTKARQ